MSPSKFRADYQELAQIAKSFSNQAERARQTCESIQTYLGVLRSGDWVGQGANAFYREMESDVIPSLKRLSNALDHAARTTQTISQIIKQAEDDAARIFRAHESDTSSLVAFGSPLQAQPGSAAGGLFPDSAIVRLANPSLPFVVIDPKRVFTEEYMLSLRNTEMRGADGLVLRSAMESLMKNPPQTEQDLVMIAAARGVPLQKIQADYQKFLEIRRTQKRTPDELDTTSEWLDPSDYPDFLGSTPSLQYGKVVGDVFGIDPVFGALLNPTGGIMGEGNSKLPQPGHYTALSMHSIFHDAAGYLRNTHGLGPGYDYLGRESQYDPTDPYTGQKSGIRYWFEKIDTPGPDLLDSVAKGIIDIATLKRKLRKPGQP